MFVLSVLGHRRNMDVQHGEPHGRGSTPSVDIKVSIKGRKTRSLIFRRLYTNENTIMNIIILSTQSYALDLDHDFLGGIFYSVTYSEGALQHTRHFNDNANMV